jgi:nucleoside-triphosphatase THEP1
MAFNPKKESMNSKAALQGFLAGMAGVAAMTLSEKLEQLIQNNMQVIVSFLIKQVISNLNFTGYSPAAICDLSHHPRVKQAGYFSIPMTLLEN